MNTFHAKKPQLTMVYAIVVNDFVIFRVKSKHSKNLMIQFDNPFEVIIRIGYPTRKFKC